MKKINKVLFVILIIPVVLNFLIINKSNANAAVFYPKEARIAINNLPKDESFEIEIMMVREQEKDPTYTRFYYTEMLEDADGIFTGFKEDIEGSNSTKNEGDNRVKTNYYYKSLLKKNISGKKSIKLNVLLEDKLFIEFMDGMVIRINDKYSVPIHLGGFDSKITKNYYFNYETMQFESNVYMEIFYILLIFYSEPVILSIILCVIFTLIIELTISKVFRIKDNDHIILFVNLFTQAILHTITLIIYTFTYDVYIWLIILLELMIIITEFLLYKRYLKDISAKRLMFFSIIANICSFSISPIISLLGNAILNSLIL